MEILDVYNDFGKVINKTVPRGSRNRDFESGEHFAVSIIFIENSNGKYLIQKIPKGQYSSTGGHIISGEKPIDAIIREVYEEIGVKLSKDEIVDLGFRLLDFPVRFLFYVKKDVELKKTILDKKEVTSVSFMSEDEIKELIRLNEFKKGHALLFREILKYKYNVITLNDIFLKYKEKYKVKFGKDDPNYFKISFSSESNKFKLFVSDNKLELYRKKKNYGNNYWKEIHKEDNIKNYDELINKIDTLINKYEGK